MVVSETVGAWWVLVIFTDAFGARVPVVAVFGSLVPLLLGANDVPLFL